MHTVSFDFCECVAARLVNPACLTGRREAAVLALYSVLPPRPAEDQGAEEGLRLLQLLIPERERPPLQTSPSSPPPPTQTQQLSSQVRPLLCFTGFVRVLEVLEMLVF